MSAGPSHLVQILLPKETGSGQSVARQWFENLLKELTDKFGVPPASSGPPARACGIAAAKWSGTISR